MKKIKTLFCLMAIACTSLFAAFLTGCNSLDQLKCKHEWSAVNVLEPSTCTEKGKGEKVCKLCEKVETVKLDFEHEPMVIEAVKPTCTEKGRTDYVVCYACETVLVPYAELSPTGHKVVKDEAVAVTCLKDGLTEGEHCEVCKVVLLEQKKIVATGHNIVAYPEQPPTCTEVGYTAGEACKNCGAYDTREEISALGEHDFSNGNLCANCGQGITISLYDLKWGDNLSGFKLILAATEEELRTVLDYYVENYGLPGGFGFYVWSEDENGGYELFSLECDFVQVGDDYSFELVGTVFDRLFVYLSGNTFEFNEFVFNDELGFSNEAYIAREFEYELTTDFRSMFLSLFELVYVGE